jgi:hypothetical protein
MQVNLSIFLSPQERFHCPTGTARHRSEIPFAPCTPHWAESFTTHSRPGDAPAHAETLISLRLQAD